MKQEETFIINIFGITDAYTGYYTININIPDTRKYNKFKMFVKDFIIINNDIVDTDVSPNVYILKSDTLLVQNNYEADESLQSNSKILSTITTKYPFVSNQSEAYFNILNINGTHNLYIDDFNETRITSGDFYVSLVVVGYN